MNAMVGIHFWTLLLFFAITGFAVGYCLMDLYNIWKGRK